jgi:hypothetical protein
VLIARCGIHPGLAEEEEKIRALVRLVGGRTLIVCRRFSSDLLRWGVRARITLASNPRYVGEMDVGSGAMRSGVELERRHLRS